MTAISVFFKASRLWRPSWIGLFWPLLWRPSVQVPIGTVVKEQGNPVVDLSAHGQEYVAVYGGSGGKGNRFFLSNENRAPTTATPGTEGQERVLHLELRTMAHAGLVGGSPCFWTHIWKEYCLSLVCVCTPAGWFSQRGEVVPVESHL